MRFRLACMDNVWKLDRILNEEDGNVISNNIPVALLGIELDRKATNIAHSIGRAAAAQDRRESDKDGRFAGGICQDTGRSDVCGRLKQRELAMGTRSARVDDTLWNAFVVKAMDLAMSTLLHRSLG